MLNRNALLTLISRLYRYFIYRFKENILLLMRVNETPRSELKSHNNLIIIIGNLDDSGMCYSIIHNITIYTTQFFVLCKISIERLRLMISITFCNTINCSIEINNKKIDRTVLYITRMYLILLKPFNLHN